MRTTLDKIRAIVVAEGLVIRRTIKPELIVPGAHLYDDLGLDELARVAVVMEIEAEFQRPDATDDQVWAMQRVADLIAFADGKPLCGAKL